jgi:hypothetical protein
VPDAPPQEPGRKGGHVGTLAEVFPDRRFAKCLSTLEFSTRKAFELLNLGRLDFLIDEMTVELSGFSGSHSA